MRPFGRKRLWLGMSLGTFVSLGCASTQIEIPTGHLPPVVGPLDTQTSATLDLKPAMPLVQVAPQEPTSPNNQKNPFGLPPALPGNDRPPVQVPRFSKDTPAAEREKAVLAAYPVLKPITHSIEANGTPLSLAEFQQLALSNSPVIRQAAADADSAFGLVIQAGLCPNPTVGYQADQWQPGNSPKPINNNGQQGGYINLLIKTVGKLSLAQQVAGFDYINALVAVRRAQIDVSTQIRTYYFSAIVAKQSMEVNKLLADMADEVYKLQLKQVMAGEAAGYEPLQLYAQAVQYRNSYIQADAAYRTAWKQLAAAAGQPDMPAVPLTGRADTSAPVFNREELLPKMLEQHTDVLTAQNLVCKAQTNLTLQKRIPYPDLQTNQYHQYDNVAKNYQFGLQLGIALPVFDANQGNIRSATAQIASAREKIRATQNDLNGKFADAFARYESNRLIAENFKERVLPSLTQAYSSLIRRYQIEPEKVGFNDIIVAQQSLSQSMQTYLSSLGSQWQAVVDVANITQIDELFLK